MSVVGTEALIAAIRRSIPLIIGFALLGVATVNGFTRLQGPRYEASARVLITTTPLARILTDTQPTFVDPSRVQDTALALASSRQIYEQAAAAQRGIGSASTLKSAVSVTADSSADLITFTAEADDRRLAADRVNAVSEAYTEFRTQLSEDQLQTAEENLRAGIDELDRGSGEAAAMEQQLDRVRTLRDVGIQDSIVVDPARTASQTSPAPVRDSVLGLSIGLVIAFLLVALREGLDTRVRSDATVEDALSAPVIGSIPTLPRGKRLVTYGRHEAEFGDRYDIVAGQLAPDHDGSHVIAVTSALQQEGKTTTSVNIAVALARRGERVVLVDLDLRTNSLSALLQVPPGEPGLKQVLEGDVPIEHALLPVSVERSGPVLPAANGHHESEYEGSLRLLPAGGTDARPRLLPTRVADVLRQLRSMATVIVVDTPAALVTAEASDISPHVDFAVVIVRQGKLTQRSLRALGRQSERWQMPIGGVIVTGTDEVTTPYTSSRR